MQEQIEDIFKERRKKRLFKLVFIKAVMVVSTITIAALLVLAIVGYKINRDLSVERSGLVQIRSIPTGATVTLNGERLFAWTNLSRMMVEGRHEIVISREGYDTWAKEIEVRAGVLHRIHYPRIFLQERERETLQNLQSFNSVHLAPNRNALLLISQDVKAWQLLPLNTDKVEPKVIDVRQVFERAEGLEVIDWQGDRVLIKRQLNNQKEWILLDLKNATRSINLTKEFGMDFAEVRMTNPASGYLLTLINHELRKVDINNASLSKILLSNVANFGDYNGRIIYTTIPNADGGRSVGLYRDGDIEGTVLFTINSSEPVLAVMNEYYGDEFLTLTVGAKLKVWQGRLPTNGQKIDEVMQVATEQELSFLPQTLRVAVNGELILAQNGLDLVVVDTELVKVSEQKLAHERVTFLDNFLFYEIKDQKLIVRDFDNTNVRELAGGVKEDGFAVITSDNRWLYYLSVDGDLVREKL